MPFDKYNAMSVNTEGTKPTYRTSVVDYTPYATATDMVVLVGSATKTVKLVEVRINADANAAGSVDFYIYKRLAANTGGTATQSAIVTMDSLDVSPTAVVNVYSAIPSSLGSGSIFYADHLATPAASGTGYPMFPYVFPFGSSPGKSITLRGVNESLAVNFAGAAVPAGLNFYISLCWTEENA